MSATGGALELNARIIYWGIDGAGKTTSVETIYAKLRPDHRGELKRVPTRLDPTVHYEELPIALGNVQGARTQLQIVAVPGGAEQAHTRKQLLDRVDGLVLVIDADPNRADENAESIDELRESLAAYGHDLEDLPCVVQYNKRDLGDPYAIEALHKRLGFGQAPVFETVASKGQGVLQVLSTISKGVVRTLRARPADESPPASQQAARPAAAPVQATEPAQPAAAPVQPAPTQTATPVAAPASPSLMDPETPLSVEPLAPPLAAPVPEVEMAAETIVDLDSPSSAIMLEAEPIAEPAHDPLSVMEAAIISEGDGVDEVHEADNAANRTELAFDKPWAQLSNEKPAPGARFGADLRVVSVGTAERAGERGVKVPLVLGNDEGETLTVALTVQLDPLLEEDPE